MSYNKLFLIYLYLFIFSLLLNSIFEFLLFYNAKNKSMNKKNKVKYNYKSLN
jgi:hypothetical protein